jgi:Uma2 family endonuclease
MVDSPEMVLPDPAEPRFTYGDYVLWQGDERWELIDGRAYLMSPAPTRLHQQVLIRLAVQVARQLQGKPCEVYVAPLDVRLPRGDEADADVCDVVQPDLVVLCDPAKLDDAGCRGAPDWVVEILSPSTQVRDHVEKRDLYERHGVREYWVVDAARRRVTIYRRDGAGGGFLPGSIEAAEGLMAVGVLPGLTIDWDAVFES